MPKIAIRMDDVGASSKRFEVYSKIPGGNFLFLKYFPPFKAWGPYRELDYFDWKSIIAILERFNAKMTVAVTATWVDHLGGSTMYNEKFPASAHLIKEAFSKGILDVANHGLTHCVVGQHLPKLFSSNRSQHREFWAHFPADYHRLNLGRANEVLEGWLGRGAVSTFVPPGNVYSHDTSVAAEELGYQFINSSTNNVPANSRVKFIGLDRVIPFHDRDLVKFGPQYLTRILEDCRRNNFEFCFVRDL